MTVATYCVGRMPRETVGVYDRHVVREIGKSVRNLFLAHSVSSNRFAYSVVLFNGLGFLFIEKTTQLDTLKQMRFVKYEVPRARPWCHPMRTVMLCIYSDGDNLQPNNRPLPAFSPGTVSFKHAKNGRCPF